MDNRIKEIRMGQAINLIVAAKGEKALTQIKEMDADIVQEVADIVIGMTLLQEEASKAIAKHPAMVQYK